MTTGCSVSSGTRPNRRDLGPLCRWRTFRSSENTHVILRNSRYECKHRYTAICSFLFFYKLSTILSVFNSHESILRSSLLIVYPGSYFGCCIGPMRFCFHQSRTSVDS